MPATKKMAGSAAATQMFKTGDIVLGRLKGYPTWPSRVVDPDNVPPKVEKARPSRAPTVYCVQFFPAGDFAWLNARDITPLPTHQIQAYLQEGHRKKDGELKRAYETALNPQEWDTRQSEWLASQAENEDQLADYEDEMEEEDGGEETEDEGKGKKRKAPKPKAKVEKKKAKVEKKPEPKAKASKPAKKAPASKQPVSKSAPENQAPADEDPLANDPVCVKVKDWRHKLQRAFLSKSLPTAEDMDAQDDIFKSIEAYKDMTIEALQYSKIGKVMKKIVTLEGIPRNDELKITDRAKKLMDGWTDFIDNSQNGANGSAPNGGDEPKAETSTSAAPKSEKAAKPKSTKPASSAKGAKKPADDVEAAEAKADGAAANGNGNGNGEEAETKEESEDKKESDMPGAEAPVEA